MEVVYQEHLATLHPSERYCSPLVEYFRAHPAILSLLEAEADVTITADDFRPIIHVVEDYIAEYRAGKLDSVTAELKLETPHSAKHAANLARYVFECRRPAYEEPGPQLIGWRMIAGHTCFEGGRSFELRPGVWVPMHCTKVSLHRKASRVASKLIELAGLDPATTTVDDMDKRNPYFVFEQKHLLFQSRGYEVFTWRRAVCLIYASPSSNLIYSFICSWTTSNCRLGTLA